MAPCCFLLCWFVLSLWGGWGFGVEGGPGFYLLRPLPSDALPAAELQEDPDPALDPRDSDLNQTELRSVLGGGFDPGFMALTPPEQEDAGDADTTRHRVSGSMPKELWTLDLDLDLEALLGRGSSSSRKKKLRRRLQQLLWSLALCPVLQAWTDLGVRFWPRHVKLGRCSAQRSCSVPPGMLCRPSKATHITILRWRCRRQRRGRGGLRCAWIPVQYPIISECKCSCPN